MLNVHLPIRERERGRNTDIQKKVLRIWFLIFNVPDFFFQIFGSEHDIRRVCSLKGTGCLGSVELVYKKCLL